MSEISLPKTMNMISTDDHLKPVMFLSCTTIDWIFILMVYVYNFRKFTGKTAIS